MGITHRDLKPENILLDKNGMYVCIITHFKEIENICLKIFTMKLLPKNGCFGLEFLGKEFKTTSLRLEFSYFKIYESKCIKGDLTFN